MYQSYLFELLGELENMPRDEAVSTVNAETEGNFRIVCEGPGYIVLEFEEDKLGAVCSRLALTHCVGRYLGSFDPEDLSPIENAELPPGTFAVRHKRFKGWMADVDSQKLVRRTGAVFSKKNDVDLRNPDTVVDVLMTDRVHAYTEECVFDANLLKQRKVSERPFFSPISLHPRYARALINLTGVRRGGTVLDPFCGTGGIVIEAAEMGMKAIASDFDPEMVAGTRENMDFYHLALHDFEVLDIGAIPERFHEIDAVVCDPPYGRSTKTGGEKIDRIYSRALEAFPKVLTENGKAGVVLPHPFENPYMKLDSMYIQYVHGTLSRHYHLFSRQ